MMGNRFQSLAEIRVEGVLSTNLQRPGKGSSSFGIDGQEC